MPIKSGTTLSGIVLSTSSIVASNGRTVPFKNKFKKGEDVWLYYSAANKLVTVERKSETRDIEHGE